VFPAGCRRPLVCRVEILAVVCDPDCVCLCERVRARLPDGDHLVARRVDDTDGVRVVAAEVDELAVRARHDVMRGRRSACRNRLDDREGVLVEDAELGAPLVGGVDLAGAVRRRYPDRAAADRGDAEDVAGRGVESRERVDAAVESLDGPDCSARAGDRRLRRPRCRDDGERDPQREEQRMPAHGGTSSAVALPAARLSIQAAEDEATKCHAFHNRKTYYSSAL
jgi:hypothetical protein